MSKRVCLDCKAITDRHPSGRCPECRRTRDKARGTTGQRGYGSAHVRLRAQWQRRLDAGEVVYCWRCLTRGKHTRIDPKHWHLGHADEDRSMYRGPECPPCNLGTASRRISRGA